MATVRKDSSKAENRPSAGRSSAGAIFPVAHGLIAGKRGHKMMAGLRETEGYLLPVLGANDAVYNNQKKGRYKPMRGDAKQSASKMIAVPVIHAQSISKMMAVPVSNVRSVAPVKPTGSHVSHALDLAVIRNKRKHYGPTRAVEIYHGQGPAKSAVSPTHQGSTPVRKASGIGQAAVGYRGTPLSDIAQQSRHGRRLDFGKAGGEDYKSYFGGNKSGPANHRADNADRTVKDLPRNAGRSAYNSSTKPGGQNSFFGRKSAPAGSVPAARAPRKAPGGNDYFGGKVGASTARVAAKKPGLLRRIMTNRSTMKIAGRWN